MPRLHSNQTLAKMNAAATDAPPKPLTLIEVMEKRAKKKLPSDVYDFIAGGAGDSSAIVNSIQAFKDTKIIPLVLNGNSNGPDAHSPLSILNGTPPILIAPTALHKLCNLMLGEIATVKAATTTNTIMVVSGIATVTLEDIAKNSKPQNIWLQLYIPEDREEIIPLIKKAEALGFGALVLTVDTPVSGERLLDIRNKFQPAKYCKPVNFSDKVLSKLDQRKAKNFKSLSWDDVSWLKSQTNLPMFIKGLLHPDDARTALTHDIAGIIVSNHGGRQLASAIAPLEALPGIVAVVKQSGKSIPVLLDGGVRHGEDVFKAIALGADAVLLGRPVLWGLAARGEDGVKMVLDYMRKTLIRTMHLTGCQTIQDIKKYGPNLIVTPFKPLLFRQLNAGALAGNSIFESGNKDESKREQTEAVKLTCKL
jgi:isopentenyl diphosphate isomerase/L-lactate dehydrogenase-like FMN-dependent dehydrogenase